MVIAIFLAFKEGMTDLKAVGQDRRLVDYYLKEYSKNFDKIYVFSWKKEEYDFGIKNVVLVSNSKNINMYLYNFILPFLHIRILKQTSVLRLMQFTPIIPAIIAKLIIGNKIVATYGYVYSEFLKTKKRLAKYFFWRIVEKIGLLFTDAIIVTTPKMEGFVKKNNFKNKIFLIPNSVNVKEFCPLERLSSEIKNILFVGRFEIEKNVENFARAVLNLKGKIRLTLVGRGPLEQKIRDILEQGNLEYKIIQSLPHKELRDLYQQTDIFVLPSFNEGYPKVLIEAMSCGVSCLVAKFDGYQYLVRDYKNGLVCDSTKDSIHEKIQELIDNKELRSSLSKEARKFVEENNDIEKNIIRELNSIKSLW
jgi:glycosyltransferase involved in cell wall biosynthesis